MNDHLEGIRRRVREQERQAKAKKKEKGERARAATRYRGLINIDYSHSKGNEYQKLLAALIQAGWVYVETSALVIEDDLPTVLQALELIARQCQDAGVLSALTIHIQGSLDFEGVPYPTQNHPNALSEVRGKPLPGAVPPQS